MPPMSYDAATHLLLVPEDTDAPQRMVRLRELGIGATPVPEFDEFARELALATGAPYAGVNFTDEHRQFFAGLFLPEMPPAGAGQRLSSAAYRSMARDHGYCPHVIARRKALVLEDVCDFPRFAGNPLVDEAGLRSYLGAPLIDSTGLVLGTVCAADHEPRKWGRAGLDTIKSMAAELVGRLEGREHCGD